jgi:50S ribosomal protein L16 3-hydroxylase
MTPCLLGGLTAREFLRRFWQKRPLFVRGAVTDWRRVLDKRALTALAARGDVESRIVVRARGRCDVRYGPFRSVPSGNSKWTLLVSGVNLHVPAAERLLRRFDFLPQARLDDVMASYAAPGGGVGPHADSYDVFLLQGRGRRLWRLARPRRFALVPGAPLALIEGFAADQELVAEPGDLLYLPPGWGHDGIALEPCLTYSIGFRAPRGAELAAAFLDWLHERGLPDARYRDAGLAPAPHPARVPGEMIDFADRVLRRIRWSRRDAARFLGEHLTTPKPHVAFRRGRGRPALARCEALLDARTQLLYSGRRFFINGETVAVAPRDARALRSLADRRRLHGARLARAPLAGLIYEWHRLGYLHLERRA